VSGVGDILVVANGFDSALGDGNITRRYDIAGDTWSLGAPAPRTRAEGAYGDTSHGGKIYAIGGRTAGSENKLDAYEVATDTWTTLADMPTSRAAAAAAVVGNSIYVMGGRTAASPCGGGALNVVERYDIDTDTWTTVSPLPSPRSDFAAVAVGGKIYVFGGCTGLALLQSLADVDVYNPVTDTWDTSPADMASGARAVLMAGRKGNTVYVIGGRDPSTGLVTGLVEAYNVAKNTWSVDTPMLTPRGETGTYSHGGSIYVPGGGQPAFGISRNENEVFKP
jgi:N-acetylneuraminic acid mutarotase